MTSKLTTALNEVLALLKQDQEFEGCIAIRIVFCLGSGLISVEGSTAKEDVEHEEWLIQIHDDNQARR
jgi:hypothetical protein